MLRRILTQETVKRDVRTTAEVRPSPDGRPLGCRHADEPMRWLIDPAGSGPRPPSQGRYRLRSLPPIPSVLRRPLPDATRPAPEADRRAPQRRARGKVRAPQMGLQSSLVSEAMNCFSGLGTLRWTMSEMDFVSWMTLIPYLENVSVLKMFGASSGFVSAWEKASMPTIRPMSVDTVEFVRTSSANRPT